MLVKLFIFTLLITLFANKGYNQTKDSAQISLQQVNITVTKIKAENFKTAGSITVLPVIYQIRTVPEALLGTTGVFVQKTTHGGGSPFLRGLTGNQTLMLIDGIRLNNSTYRYGPNQYLNTVDPFIINQIEIFRGGGSVAYGSDALGGTIQVLTAEPKFSEKTILNGQIITKYATGNMEKTLRTETELSTAKFAFKAGASINNFGNLIGGAVTGEQSPSGYKQFAFDFKAIISLKKDWNLVLSHHSLVQKHVPLYYRYQLENFAINEFDPQERQLSYFKVSGKTKHKWLKETTITASWQTTNESRISGKKNSMALRTETDQVRTAGFIFNVLSDIKKNWTTNWGLEIYDDLVKSKRIDQLDIGTLAVQSRGLYPNESKYLSYALYAINSLKINNLQFTLGGRFNGFKLQIKDEILGKIDVNPNAVVGNASIAYTIANNSNLYVSYNSGFRAPNIDDMGTLGIVDFRYELPAYNLKPEISYNFETGYKFRSQKFLMGFALFQLNLRNLISRVKVAGQKINGINVYKKENIEHVYIRGAELETEYKLNNLLKAYAGVTYLYGQNVTKNEPIRRIPPLNGRVGLEYRYLKWFINSATLFANKQARLAAGDIADNRIAKGGTPAWMVINFTSGYDSQHFSIYATAENLSNKDYRMHGSGINGVGRSLWLTFTGRLTNKKSK